MVDLRPLGNRLDQILADHRGTPSCSHVLSPHDHGLHTHVGGVHPYLGQTHFVNQQWCTNRVGNGIQENTVLHTVDCGCLHMPSDGVPLGAKWIIPVPAGARRLFHLFIWGGAKHGQGSGCVLHVCFSSFFTVSHDHSDKALFFFSVAQWDQVHTFGVSFASLAECDTFLGLPIVSMTFSKIGHDRRLDPSPQRK